MLDPIKPLSTTESPDERANTFTALAGLFLSLLGASGLLLLVWRGEGWTYRLSLLVYGFSLVGVHGFSTIYHATCDPVWKLRWRRMDHASIYLLIAGTYTPFALVSLGGFGGAMLATVVWGLAVAGITIKVLAPLRSGILSTVFYLLLSWLAVGVFRPLLEALSGPGFVLLLVGGAFYTGGLYFFASKQLKYHHAYWHLCVICGSLSHYLTIAFYVRPN